MKKFLSLLLAALMVFALCAPAMAEGEGGEPTNPRYTGTLTIPLPDGDKGGSITVKAYQIMKVQYDANGYFTSLDWLGHDALAENDTTAEIKAYAEENAVGLPATEARATATASSTAVSATLEGLEPGTYIILLEGGKYTYEPMIGSITLVAKEATDPADGNPMKVAVVNPEGTKWSKPTIDKYISKDETSSIDQNKWKKDNFAIGDTVTFDIFVNNIPYYPTDAINYHLSITDTMSKGLTFGEITKVEVGTRSNNSFTPNENGTLNGYVASAVVDNKFTIDFTGIYKTQLQANAGKAIHIQYTATINNEVELNEETNTNDVVLTYSNNPYVAEKYETDDSEVKYYTYGLKVFKYDVSNENTALAGATFQLFKGNEAKGTPMSFVKDTDGYYYPATGDSAVTDLVTPEDGHILIKGLDEGTYTLHETEAPEGYTKAADVTVVIDAHDTNTKELKSQTETIDPQEATVDAAVAQAIAKVQVANSKGVTIPGTGGMGTTVFMVVGIALMAGVVVIMMVSNRKKAKKAE